MSVLTRARQRTGPTVHAGLTDGAACAPAGATMSAANAAPYVDAFHASNRISHPSRSDSCRWRALNTPASGGANEPPRSAHGGGAGTADGVPAAYGHVGMWSDDEEERC